MADYTELVAERKCGKAFWLATSNLLGWPQKQKKSQTKN